MKFFLIKTFTVFCLINIIQNQHLISQSSAEKPGIGRGTLESQFNYMIYESDKQDNYRIVKSWWMYNIRNQLKDSLSMFNDSIKSLQGTILSLNNEIDTLTASLDQINLQLKEVTKEKESIKLLGVTLNKKIYKSLMWTVIGGLAFTLFVFIILFKRSNSITVRSRNDLKELKDEFESFRKKSLVREQQLVRKLYDEVLKYKNKVQQ